jgi:hypothetical protein
MKTMSHSEKFILLTGRMNYIEEFILRMERHSATQIVASCNSPSWIGYHNAMEDCANELDRYDEARKDKDMSKERSKGDDPAFPGGVAGTEYGDHAGEPMYDGITKREWFAGMAIQGIIAFEASIRGGQERPAMMLAQDCRRAYMYADAMLAESEKGKP